MDKFLVIESEGQQEVRQQREESQYRMVHYFTGHSFTRNPIGCSVTWDISAFLESSSRATVS